MRRSAYVVSIAVATAVATVANVPSSPASPVAPAPAFVAMKCPDGIAPPGVDVDCGFVRVPEDRSDPDGRLIKVAAAVVHASGESRPDPIVMVQGGPSFGAISDFALGAYLADAEFLTDRDLILVDTRGTGISKPRLGCPELDRAEVKSFYSKPTIHSDAFRLARLALRKCWDRLVSEGVDPSSFTSDESAADLDALRQALGVDQWNLLAASADGILGGTYLRLFPGGIRSVIFDSAMATHMTYSADLERGRAVLLEKMFAGCRANDACRATYPGIRKRFYTWVDRLAAEPIPVTVKEFRPEPVTLLLDGIGLFADAASLVYPGDVFTPSLIHDPLRYIWRVTHGHARRVYEEFLGQGPVTNSHYDDFFAQGKTMSYICHDLVGFTTRGDQIQVGRDLPVYRERFLNDRFDLDFQYWVPASPAGCEVWDVGRAPGWQRQPVASAIPSLVLAGEYDWSVPSYVVRQVGDKLSRSTYVEFPASAHLQLGSFTNGSECAREIAGAFLAQPEAAVDTSCVAELPRIDFTPPG